MEPVLYVRIALNMRFEIWLYPVHQTRMVILCLAGCSDLHARTKKQVIKYANFVHRRRSNLIGVAKERHLDHRHRESGTKQFKNGPKFMQN